MPSVLVVDASVMAPAVADGGEDGQALRVRLTGEALAAPDLLCIEVMSVLRRQARTGTLTAAEATTAINDLLSLPVSVFPTGPLLRRMWALRDNLTAYDATYIALAEALACPLLTADPRLANAPSTRCPIELV
ncbi:MAG: type II toxin-antitoxin system VapC family toxin [Solirubrobacterales bacterium]